MAENPKFNEYKDEIIKILAKMFDYLALNGDFKVQEKGQRIAVAISSDNAGRIIGRKGQTLESLQLLVNRIMFKMDENCPHITLDIDGYASGSSKESKEESAVAANENGNPAEYRRRPRRGNGGNGEAHSSVEQLEKQALDAAKEVKRWGEPVKLPEMNAHDRRIIHITLKDDPEVTTESIGEGAMKKVVISLSAQE